MTLIPSRIQIEDGPIFDTFTKWGFIYMSSSTMFAAPEKKRDTTNYVEEAGEHNDPRTVDNAFDYEVKFLVEAPNKNIININSKISIFNNAIREKFSSTDVKRCKIITLYDDYKRCKITGIPEIISNVDKDDYFRRKDGHIEDFAVIKLTIHVDNPNLCDFNMDI